MSLQLICVFQLLFALISAIDRPLGDHADNVFNNENLINQEQDVNDPEAEKCEICNCYAKYNNRDIMLPFLPYAETIYPTEEECLAMCFLDRQKCQGVIYGIIGGNAGVICEFYNVSGLPNSLYYHYAMNYYQPTTKSYVCTLKKPIFIRPEKRMKEPEAGRALFRKRFYVVAPKIYEENFGRKRRTIWSQADNA